MDWSWPYDKRRLESDRQRRVDAKPRVYFWAVVENALRGRADCGHCSRVG